MIQIEQHFDILLVLPHFSVASPGIQPNGSRQIIITTGWLFWSLHLDF